MTRILHLNKFKRKFGLTQSQVNSLSKRGLVTVQQSGYPGHAMCHPKIVVFDMDRIKEVLGISKYLSPRIIVTDEIEEVKIRRKPQRRVDQKQRIQELLEILKKAQSLKLISSRTSISEKNLKTILEKMASKYVSAQRFMKHIDRLKARHENIAYYLRIKPT